MLAVKETSDAMALDGVILEGVSVHVRRPNVCSPAIAAALIPALERLLSKECRSAIQSRRPVMPWHWMASCLRV